MSIAHQPSQVLTDREVKISEAAHKAIAYRKLKEGDPFPFIRHEWPSLIITDPNERAAFAEFLERDTDLDLRLDDFQYDAIRSVFDLKHTQLYISGGTKLGKGMIVGGIIVNIWFSLFSDSSKIILVGPTTDHLKRNLFAEACKWREMMTSYVNGQDDTEVLKESIEDPKNKLHLVVLANTQSGEGMSGNHSSSTLFIFDEASGVPEDHYNNALSQCKFTIAISNPRLPSGWFYNGFPRDFDTGATTINAGTGPRRVMAIGGVHCINVKAKRLMNNISPIGGITLNGRTFAEGQVIPPELHHLTKPLIPGQVCYDLCKSLEASRPREEVIWAVYGKFPSVNKEFMIFDPAWKKFHAAKWEEAFNSVMSCKAIGFDVAASSTGDYSAIAFGDVYGCKEIYVTRNPNLMDLKGHFYALCQNRGIDPRTGFIPIAIDSIGVGKGLSDALEADGCLVLRVENGRAAEHNKEQYVNRRAECYGELADAMNPTMSSRTFCIPNDADIWQELLAVERIYSPAGRQYKLIPKRRPPAQRTVAITDNRQSIEEKIGRSPDKSDAVAMLYQAVQLLPEFGLDVFSQCDPGKLLLRYEIEQMGLFKIYHCKFLDGKSVDYSEQEFVEFFGLSPMTYDYEQGAMSLMDGFVASGEKHA